MELSADFLAYCAREGIDSAHCFDNVDQVPRFVRVNPRSIDTLLKRVDEEAVEQSGMAVPVENSVNESTVTEKLTRVLSQELRKVSPDVRVEPIDWIPPEFFAFQITPRTFPLSTCWLYSERHLYGMDAGSMCTVAALGPIRQEDNVLDLCCAPGMKLALISDTRENSGGERSRTGSSKSTALAEGPETSVERPISVTASGVAVGVDVSLSRLFTTRSILRKYSVPRVSLFLCDGRLFDPERAEESLRRNLSGGGTGAALDRHLFRLGKRLRATEDTLSSTPQATSTVMEPGSQTTTSISSLEGHHGWLGKVNSALRSPTFVFQSESEPSPSTVEGERNGKKELWVVPKLYDKVLVDVECTHDGSIAHLPTTQESVAGPNKYKTGRMKHLGSTTPDQPGIAQGEGAPPRSERKGKKNDEVSGDEVAEGEKPASHLDASDYGALLLLQETLLERGFTLLKPNGILVYSTCSFSESQNENIIRSFLRRHENEKREPKLSGAPSGCEASNCHCVPRIEKLLFAPRGTTTVSSPSAADEQVPAWCHRLSTRTTPGFQLPEAVRLTPKESGTSFQFICRIRKVPDPIPLPLVPDE